jgi:hypothetical protein
MNAAVYYFLLGFSAINLFFVTYSISLVPLVVPDASSFEYPRWPPRALVDALQDTWARNVDLIFLERPVWYKAFMWWEMLFFGPYYAAAIYALLRRRNWIRMPSIVYSSVMLTKMSVIVAESLWGQFASPCPLLSVGAHVPYIVIPLGLLAYFLSTPLPFPPAIHSKARRD